MSLIESMMETCVIMNKVRQSDGEGGFITEWENGPNIKVVIVADTSLQARIAEKDGVTNTYTITTEKNVSLDYHDVIKRLKDGSVYRITSSEGTKVSPIVSTLDMAQVTAEKWSLT